MARVHVQVVRRLEAEVPVELEQLAGPCDRKDEVPCDDLARHGMQRELERRDDAEIPAAPTHGPEEVGILAGAGVQEPAVGGDDIDRLEIVEREAKSSRHATKPAAERETRDAGVRDRARRRDEPKGHRLVIELAEQAAARDVRGARHGIDPNAAEVRQVDLHAAVAGRPAGVAVATALDGEQEIALARESDGRADVGDTARLHDQRRMPVDRFVQHATRLVVAWLAR